MTTMTGPPEFAAAPTCLLVAFELSQRTWKLGFTVGSGERPPFVRSLREPWTACRPKSSGRKLD